MDIGKIDSNFQKLLDVFSSNIAAFEIVSHTINIVASTPQIVGALNEIQVQIEEGALDFANFDVPTIIPRINYAQRVEPESVFQDFAIVDLTGIAVLYTGGQFYDYNSGAFFQEIKNVMAYYALYNFLKSAEFGDHHNSADQEIIVYSSGKGILKIKYESIAPAFKPEIDIQDKVTKLLDAMKEQQFRTYFKNSLFDFAMGNEIGVSQIIISGSNIISAAKRDLEIALRQFDFEKFRDALYSQKDKFFLSIREVLSKIYGQIIGIPISITAAVYTTYKTEHTKVVPILILISFIVYIVTYMVIQLSFYRDIQEIKTDFLRDFSIIKTQSGLPDDDITGEYNKVERKVTSTMCIAICLMAAVAVLGLTVIVFICLQL